MTEFIDDDLADGLEGGCTLSRSVNVESHGWAELIASHAFNSNLQAY